MGKDVLQNEERSSVVDCLVVGMGPAGLVSAIEAAKKGKSVTLIEQRGDFTRTQRIAINNDEVKKYFVGLTKEARTHFKKDLIVDLKNPTLKASEEAVFSLYKQRALQLASTLKAEARFLGHDLSYINETAVESQKRNVNYQEVLKLSKELESAKNLTEINCIFNKIDTIINSLTGKLNANSVFFVQAKDIQAYLKNHAELFENQQQLLESKQMFFNQDGKSFFKNQRMNTKNGHITLLQPPQYSQLKINQLDSEKQILEVNFNINGKSIIQDIHFANLIEADGTGRFVANLLKDKDALKTELLGIEPGNPNSRPVQPRQKAHFQLSIEYKDKRAVNLMNYAPHGDENLKLTSIRELRAHGWNKDVFPQFYMLPNKKKTKFYIAGEIPEKIVAEKSPEKQVELLEDWGRILLKTAYDFNDVEKMQLAFKSAPSLTARQAGKNRMTATAFDVSLDYVVVPAMQLGKGGHIALVGDARAKPNFHFGHGTIDAIRDALKVVELINDKNELNSDQYLKHHQQQLDKLISSMNAAEADKAHEFTQAIKSFYQEISKISEVREIFPESSEHIDKLLSANGLRDSQLTNVDLYEDCFVPIVKVAEMVHKAVHCPTDKFENIDPEDYPTILQELECKVDDGKKQISFLYNEMRNSRKIFDKENSKKLLNINLALKEAEADYNMLKRCMLSQKLPKIINPSAQRMQCYGLRNSGLLNATLSEPLVRAIHTKQTQKRTRNN